MRRPEYGAKPPTAQGQPAEVGKRRGPVGLVLNTIEWAARVVVHYPQYLWQPMVGVVALVLSLNLLGDAIRDALDPKTRR